MQIDEKARGTPSEIPSQPGASTALIATITWVLCTQGVVWSLQKLFGFFRGSFGFVLALLLAQALGVSVAAGVLLSPKGLRAALTPNERRPKLAPRFHSGASEGAKRTLRTLIAGLSLQTFLFGGMNLLLALWPQQHALEATRSAALRSLWEDKAALTTFCVASALVAPLLEEWFFRGLVLRSLSESGKPRRALILSAVFFGLSHVYPLPALLAGLAGLFLGALRQRGTSLSTLTAIHALSNTCALTLEFFPLPQAFETTPSALLLSTTGAALLGLCIHTTHPPALLHPDAEA